MPPLLHRGDLQRRRTRRQPPPTHLSCLNKRQQKRWDLLNQLSPPVRKTFSFTRLRSASHPATAPAGSSEPAPPRILGRSRPRLRDPAPMPAQPTAPASHATARPGSTPPAGQRCPRGAGTGAAAPLPTTTTDRRRRLRPRPPPRPSRQRQRLWQHRSRPSAGRGRAERGGCRRGCAGGEGINGGARGPLRPAATSRLRCAAGSGSSPALPPSPLLPLPPPPPPRRGGRCQGRARAAQQGGPSSAAAAPLRHHRSGSRPGAGPAAPPPPPPPPPLSRAAAAAMEITTTP